MRLTELTEQSEKTGVDSCCGTFWRRQNYVDSERRGRKSTQYKTAISNILFPFSLLKNI